MFAIQMSEGPRQEQQGSRSRRDRCSREYESELGRENSSTEPSCIQSVHQSHMGAQTAEAEEGEAGELMPPTWGEGTGSG